MKNNYNKLAMKWMLISIPLFLFTAMLVSFLAFSLGREGSFYYSLALGVVMLVSGLIWVAFHILWLVNLLRWRNSLEFDSIVKTFLSVTIVMFFLYLPIAWILTFVTNKYYCNL